MMLCSTGPQFWHASTLELKMKHLQLYVRFFSRWADQIKQAPAPAQSGFNLRGPRCQSNLTTLHCILPPSFIHPYLTWLATLAHLLGGFIPTSWCHLGRLWTHNICCRRRQLSPACHDIDTETDSLRQSCARVHEAATPPAGWMEKHTPHSCSQKKYNSKDEHIFDLLRW